MWGNVRYVITTRGLARNFTDIKPNIRGKYELFLGLNDKSEKQNRVEIQCK